MCWCVYRRRPINIMTTSSFQLRQTQPNGHSSSLTLYTHGQSTNLPAPLPCLAERNFGGKVAILPSKMTYGVNSEISGPIAISKSQKTSNEKRTGKIYVSCLQTSLSTTWRQRSLENDKKDNIDELENTQIEMSSDINQKSAKRNERNRDQNRAQKGHNTTSNSAQNNESNSQNCKEKAAGRGKANRLERQDSNVSVQLSKGKQLNIKSERKASPSSYSETNLDSPETCNSFVYIENKLSSNQACTVLVQKSHHLCRSITISEASLSSALNRQANISPSSRITYKQRNSQRSIPAISVQNKNKRSFTISNDTTDGRLRTIYESTMEETHE